MKINGNATEAIPSDNPDPPSIKTAAQEKRLREASQLYETHFLKEMIKAMRGTVPENGWMKPSQAEKIFRDQLDDRYADQWAKQGGIGLNDLIFEQLKNRYGEQLGIKRIESKPLGPISLKNSEKFSLRELKSSHIPKTDKQIKNPSEDFQIDYQFQKSKYFKEPIEISSPWSGVVHKKTYLGPDELLLEIDHSLFSQDLLKSTIMKNPIKNPSQSLLLRSQMVFHGVFAQNLAEGTKVEAGETVGWIGPESNTLFWNLNSIQK